MSDSESDQGIEHDHSDFIAAKDVVTPLTEQPDSEPAKSPSVHNPVTPQVSERDFIVPVPYPVPAAVTTAEWVPNFSCMPRFGFPQSTLTAIAAAEIAFHRSQALQQLSVCEQQWAPALRGVQMLSHAVPAEMVSLRRLSRKFGIPPHVRGIVWLTLSGTAVRVEENEGFCAKLLDRFGVVGGDLADSIEKDLQRTFPEHPLLVAGGVGQRRLRRVLHALCWRNPLIDYCQSFNFIAALLLLFLDDEEAVFWTMCYILETLLPNDYYGTSLIGLRTDQAVLGELLKVHLPKLATHLAKVGFDPGVLVPAWVMSLFVGVLPITAVVPVWDYLLSREPVMEPSSVPLAICIALLKMHGDVLLTMDDPGEMLVTLTQRVQTTCDGLKIVKIANELKVQEPTLRALRRKYRNRIAQDAANRAAEACRVEAAARLALQQQAAASIATAAARAQDAGSPMVKCTRLAGSRARDSFGASPPSNGVPIRPRADSVMRSIAPEEGSDDDSSSDVGGEEMNVVS
jgi:hypothetical protein